MQPINRHISSTHLSNSLKLRLQYLQRSLQGGNLLLFAAVSLVGGVMPVALVVIVR